MGGLVEHGAKDLGRLNDEHRLMESRMQLIDDAVDSPDDPDWQKDVLRKSVRFLAENLPGHMYREEEGVFLTAANQLGLETTVDTLRQQHNDLRQMLEIVQQQEKHHQWEALTLTMTDLVELLRDHIAGEETGLFPVVSQWGA